MKSFMWDLDTLHLRSRIQLRMASSSAETSSRIVENSLGCSLHHSDKINRIHIASKSALNGAVTTGLFLVNFNRSNHLTPSYSTLCNQSTYKKFHQEQWADSSHVIKHGHNVVQNVWLLSVLLSSARKVCRLSSAALILVLQATSLNGLNLILLQLRVGQTRFLPRQVGQWGSWSFLSTCQMKCMRQDRSASSAGVGSSKQIEQVCCDQWKSDWISLSNDWCDRKRYLSMLIAVSIVSCCSGTLTVPLLEDSTTVQHDFLSMSFWT